MSDLHKAALPGQSWQGMAPCDGTVMVDAPMRTASNDLPPLASPLGLSIHQYRQQTTAVIDDLVHIIESLEI